MGGIVPYFFIAGENIEVLFAGQKVRTTANADGTWQVKLKPVKTKKKGETLTITGKNKLVYSDVLVGDVWVASGQSNMECTAVNRCLKKQYKTGT